MSHDAVARTSRNTVMLFAGTLTRMVAAFALVLYAARQLGVEGFGAYGIAVHYFELMLSLAATASGILLTRDLARWQRHENQLITSASIIAVGLAALASLLLLLLSAVGGFHAHTRQAIQFAAMATIPGALCVLLEAVFVARERAEFVMLGTGLESGLRIGLSLFVLWLGYGVLALIAVFVLFRCLLLLAYLVFLAQISHLRWEYRPIRFRRFAARWRVFAAENWMATLYTSLDVTILSVMAGETAVGLYNAAYKVIRLGIVVAKSYTTAVFPVLSRLHSHSRDAFQRLSLDSIRMMLVIAMPIVIAVSVLTERITELLYTTEYAGAVPVLRVLVWVLVLEFLNPFLSHTLFAGGQQAQSMKVAAISLAVNLVATLWLVGQYGAVGAAVGTVLGGGVACCCYLRYLMPGLPLRGTMIDLLRVSLATLGLAAVLFALRDWQWSVLAVVGILVYGILACLVRCVRSEDLQILRGIFPMGGTAR